MYVTVARACHTWLLHVIIAHAYGTRLQNWGAVPGMAHICRACLQHVDRAPDCSTLLKLAYPFGQDAGNLR